METWQKAHITANIHKLVNTTIVGEQLLRCLQSENILANVDLEEIRCKEGLYKQASKLLDIIQTRENGYSALARSFAESKQTGSLSILLDGFSKHAFPQIKVNLFGQIKSLSEYFDANEMSSIIEKLRAATAPEQLINFYDSSNSNKDAVNLMNDNIPAETSDYISRSLSKKTKLNEKLFRSSCPDVFVFKGFDHVRLATAVHPNILALSTPQLEKISSRFIILERDEDWKVIRQKTKAPAHLIVWNAEDDIMILEETTGGSKVIERHLSYQNNSSDYISETQMIAEIFQDSRCNGICICDVPGMGKTRLLTNLARSVIMQYPERIVASFNLQELTEQVVQSEHDISVNTGLSLLRNLLLQKLSTSPLAQIILEQLLEKNNVNYELFIDAFDEVPHEHLSTAKSVLIKISEMPQTRLCVTSRKHFQHELEESLGVIAYDIVPFTEQNRIDFLVHFWKNENNSLDEKKLREFASFCLEKLKENIKEDESDISGVPLQCRLLAQVYRENAEIYSNTNRNVAPEEICTFEKSLPDLYKRYKEAQFSSAEEGEGEAIKEYHTFLALQTLFSAKANKFYTLSPKVIINEEKVLAVGLLERSSSNKGELQFFHRSFAELIAAEFFANIIYADQQNTLLDNVKIKAATNFLFKKVLHTRTSEFLVRDLILQNLTTLNKYDYPIVVYFLNSFLNSPVISSLDNFKTLTASLANYFNSQQFPEILLTSLSYNYTNIFGFFTAFLPHFGLFSFWKYKRILLLEDNIGKLLRFAVRYTSVQQLEELSKLYSECLGSDISDFAKLINDPSLLGIAIIRPDFQMVQYFEKQLHPIKLALEQGIMFSAKDSEEKLQQKINICEFLLAKDPSSTKELNLQDSPEFHVKLINFFLTKGIHLKSIVHQAAWHYSSDDLHEFCRFIIYNDNSAIVEQVSSTEWLDALRRIIWRDITSKPNGLKTVEMILRDSNIKYCSKEEKRDFNLHTIAAEREQPAKVLKLFINFGVNCMQTNEYDKNTFLHYAANYLEPHDYYDLLCFLSDAGETEVFNARNIKQQLPVNSTQLNSNFGNKILAIFANNGVNLKSMEINYYNCYRSYICN